MPNLLSSQKATKSAGKLIVTGLLLRDQNRTTSLPALRLPLSLTKPAKNSTKQPNESVKSIKSNVFPIILPLILQKRRWIPIMKTCGTLYYPSTELCVRLEPLMMVRQYCGKVSRMPSLTANYFVAIIYEILMPGDVRRARRCGKC